MCISIGIVCRVLVMKVNKSEFTFRGIYGLCGGDGWIETTDGDGKNSKVSNYVNIK